MNNFTVKKYQRILISILSALYLLSIIFKTLINFEIIKVSNYLTYYDIFYFSNAIILAILMFIIFSIIIENKKPDYYKYELHVSSSEDGDNIASSKSLIIIIILFLYVLMKEKYKNYRNVTIHRVKYSR